MSFAHANSLCHTNLKPENVILARHADWSDLRIINFPISVGFDHNKSLNEKWQAPHFLAPELFDSKQTPDEKSDGWSCGAIVHLLLSGKAPFEGATDAEVMANIKAGKLDLTGDLWDNISESAKDMIKGLLTVDINKRMSVEEAMEHDWIANSYQIREKENTDAENEALRNLKRFNSE